MKKIAFIFICLILVGCSDHVEITDNKFKRDLVNKSIRYNNQESQKKMENIIIKLKKQTNNPKISEDSKTELKNWETLIEQANNEKKLEEEKERERKEAKKKQIFIEKLVFELIKSKLRDPSSYQLDYCSYVQDNNIYNITHSYRAKNGFGGYVKERDKLTVVLTSGDFELPVNLAVLKIMLAELETMNEKLRAK